MSGIGKSPRGRFKIPENLTPEGRICFCINLPDDPEHTAVFWGLVELLTHRYNWGEPLTEASQTVADYWAEIWAENRQCFEDARTMANRGCGQDFEVIERYTPDGKREISTDNGVTWVEDTGDPRFNGTILPPPLWLIVGQNNRCEGATTGAINFENLITEILTTGVDIGFSGLVGLIVAIVCGISAGVACAIAGIVASIATAIVQIGANAIQADMTAAAYDIFKCILFCHIEDDASFTEAGWMAVKADISNQLSGNAEFMLWNLVNAVGPVGLTNICRQSVLVTADCDDCNCEAGCPDELTIITGTLVSHIGDTYVIASALEVGTNRQAVNVSTSADQLSGCCCLSDVSYAPFTPNGEAYIDCQNVYKELPIGFNNCFRAWSVYNSLDGQSFTVTFTTNPCQNPSTSECFE